MMISLEKTCYSAIFRLAAIAVGLGISIAVATAKTTKDAQEFAPPISVKNSIANAKLAGNGEYRWFGLKIYDASLWTGNEGYSTAFPRAAPFALELRYARALEGTRIAEVSIDQIEKLGFGDQAKHKVWRQLLEEVIKDVSIGDRLAAIYHPVSGTSFYRNDKWIGDISDEEFSTSFFAIWLDSRSSASELREALLRKATPN